MKILQCFCELVNDKADVYIFEYILANYVVQVGLHELKKKIDVLIIISADRIVKFYHVAMINLS